MLFRSSLDGLNAFVIGFEKKDEMGKNLLYLNFKSLYRADSTDLNYLLYPDLWNPGKLNNTLNLGFEHKYNYKRGDGNIHLGLRSSAIGSGYDYANIQFSSINKSDLGKINFNTRMYIQYQSGVNGAPESDLYLAGANPEELMNNKYTRSTGFFPMDWMGYGNTTNHFHAGGGLNLRGYAGYLVVQEDKNSQIVAAYKGNSGAAINIEME